MPLESQFTEEQLFDNLISSLVHSVWIALGKIKSPMSDKIERNIFAASMNIDMLDMLYKRMDGNLSEQEDSYLSHILSELKMNYIEEKKIGDDLPEEEKPKDTKSAETKSKGDKKPAQKVSAKKQTKTKKPTAKSKDKK
ncbi:MAG: DUF1844 domain-containing protein [Candidatus Neomarinimicrobiota bacterium]